MKDNDENKNKDEISLNELFEEFSKEISDEPPTISSTQKYVLSSFPTEMSCTDAMNEVIECHSFGGQARNLYRYGTLATCKDQRARFKFCMMNKLRSEKAQKEAVARFYMEALAKQKKEKGSSEDIWKARTILPNHPFEEES